MESSPHHFGQKNYLIHGPYPELIFHVSNRLAQFPLILPLIAHISLLNSIIYWKKYGVIFSMININFQL